VFDDLMGRARELKRGRPASAAPAHDDEIGLLVARLGEQAGGSRAAALVVWDDDHVTAGGRRQMLGPRRRGSGCRGSVVAGENL
jgi:hypothetical protein